MDQSATANDNLENSAVANSSFQSCRSVLYDEVESSESGGTTDKSSKDQKNISLGTAADDVSIIRCSEKNNIEQNNAAVTSYEQGTAENVKISGEQLRETVQVTDSENQDSHSSADIETQSASACTSVESLDEAEVTEPVKPPRRKRTNAASAEAKGSKGGQIISNVDGKLATSPTRKRQLPTIPNVTEKNPERLDSAVAQQPGNIRIVSVENTDDKLQDIVCNPVMTSSPVNYSASSHTPNSSRIISFISSTSPDTVKKANSFYDYLHNPENDESGGDSGQKKEGVYDSVSQISRASNTDSRYDEVEGVIVNQEAYVMPVADESDEWTDEDPWGSDFETDDDDTKSRVIEEDPYDSVEVMPLSQRRRPLKFVADSAGNTPEVRQTKLQRLREALSMPGSAKGLPSSIQGIPGTLQSCFNAGMKKMDSLPYMPNRRKISEREDEEESEYVEPNIADTQQYHQPVMPPMKQGLTKQQAKRYQITKFFLESESNYMQLLDTLIKILL